jgi:hypothetical protein
MKLSGLCHVVLFSAGGLKSSYCVTRVAYSCIELRNTAVMRLASVRIRTIPIQTFHLSPQTPPANNFIGLLFSKPLSQTPTPALFSLGNHLIFHMTLLTSTAETS